VPPPNGSLREPDWWATPAAGVPDRKHYDLLGEQRVVEVIARAIQEDPSSAPNG
jgi:hypothetical protein